LPSPKKDYLGLFGSIVRAGFLGEGLRFQRSNYALKPMLLGKYDVLRSILSPGSEFERLVKDLPRDFKSVAKTELYRKSSGWIEKGEKDRKFKEILVREKPFIVPILSKQTVGIDTSGESDGTYICIACLCDAKCGYAFLDRHLQLPKAKEPVELKWAKLNRDYRKKVMENLQILFQMSASAILIIKTNALVGREEKLTDVFVKLIDGCFSGYKHNEGEARAKLRSRFFELTDDVQIHCDSDFTPLTTPVIVHQLVKTLSGGRPFTPLHVVLKSEASHPIQLSDIICGAVKSLIQEDKESELGFKQISFNKKLKGKSKDAKVFVWENQARDPGVESRKPLARTLPPLEAP